MKKLQLLLIVSSAVLTANAQYIHKIKADSVLITNDSCTAELNLENSTKHIKGFLYNKGNGRTEFRRAEKLNDSTLVFGEDTLLVKGAVNSVQTIYNSDGSINENRAINFNNTGSLSVLNAATLLFTRGSGLATDNGFVLSSGPVSTVLTQNNDLFRISRLTLSGRFAQLQVRSLNTLDPFITVDTVFGIAMGGMANTPIDGTEYILVRTNDATSQVLLRDQAYPYNGFKKQTLTTNANTFFRIDSILIPNASSGWIDVDAEGVDEDGDYHVYSHKYKFKKTSGGILTLLPYQNSNGTATIDDETKDADFSSASIITFASNNSIVIRLITGSAATRKYNFIYKWHYITF